MRRFLWPLLIFVLCLCACQDRDEPTNVSDEPTGTPIALTILPSEPPVASNPPSMDCDGEITWETVDGKLTLVFHTQEALEQWAASGQEQEWNTATKAVRFEEGVESIPAEAFAHRSIVEAFFPPSLREIGDYAFLRCDTLEQIHWQEGLREIGKCAFEGTAIRELVLPDASLASASMPFRRCRIYKPCICRIPSKTLGTLLSIAQCWRAFACRPMWKSCTPVFWKAQAPCGS